MTSAQTTYTTLRTYLKDQHFGPQPLLPYPVFERPYIIEHRRHLGFRTLDHGPYMNGYYRLEDAYGRDNECDGIARGYCAGPGKPKPIFSS
jgi:hypothetical protein